MKPWTLDNKYQIEQLLGKGGMGAVYRATHLVTDFGIAHTGHGPIAYLVMEYLDGCTLAEIIEEEGALPIAWVIDILEQVCAAVEEAHRAGIIHRDLKPDNIWLEPNGRGGYTVKVLDFGLVKLRGADEISRGSTQINADLSEFSEESATLIKSDSLTAVGSVMGTPFYMSPEQCRGEQLDTRSDIYSLGVVAYRLLTGETPFAGSPHDVIELHKTAVPPPIREKNRKLPRKMARIVMSALAKDPAERPQSAAGFAAALRASWEGPGHFAATGIRTLQRTLPDVFQDRTDRICAVHVARDPECVGRRQWTALRSNTTDDLRHRSVCHDGHHAFVCVFLRLGGHCAGRAATDGRAVASGAD